MTAISSIGKRLFSPSPCHRLAADADEGELRAATAPGAAPASAGRRARRPILRRRRSRSQSAPDACGRAPGHRAHVGPPRFMPRRNRPAASAAATSASHSSSKTRCASTARRRGPAARGALDGARPDRRHIDLEALPELGRLEQARRRGPSAAAGLAGEAPRRGRAARPCLPRLRSPRCARLQATSAWPTSKGESASRQAKPRVRRLERLGGRDRSCPGGPRGARSSGATSCSRRTRESPAPRTIASCRAAWRRRRGEMLRRKSKR